MCQNGQKRAGRRTHVDGRVIRNIVANWEIDPLFLGNEARSSLCMVLDDVQHVARANSTAEQDPGATERSSGQDNASSGVEGNEAVRADIQIVSLDTSDQCTLANYIEDVGVVLVSEVWAFDGALVVSSDRTSTLAIDEGECTVAVHEVLAVGGVVEGDVSVAFGPQQSSGNVGNLHQVSLSVCRGMICPWKTSLQFRGVRLVETPRRRPASLDGEIDVRRKPVKTDIHVRI